MKYYHYLEQFDIHVINYSGIIDLNEGLTRMGQLEKVFKSEHGPGKSFKILMDARGYLKASPEIHDTLAKISREKFNNISKSRQFIVAVVNDLYTNTDSPEEQWFTDEDDAMEWLNSAE